MTARPRLLFLCQTLPYPPDGGVNIRTFHVMRLLARAFDITALCFFRRADRPTPAHVEASLAGLGRCGRVEAFRIPQEHDRARLAWDHLRSVARRRTYTIYSYESRAFRRRLLDLLATEHFDLAHLDSLDLVGYLPPIAARGLPVVCAHHNVESELLRRRAAAEGSTWRRLYMAHQARLYEAEERRACAGFALNVAVSDLDREAFGRLAPGARFTVVPNGVDVDGFRPATAGSDGAVFVGGASWFPNRDALEYFSADVLPRLRAGGLDVPVRWVGRASAEDQRAYAARGIELTGYVADIRPYVAQAGCFVVPLRVGGGTRLKVLDAWAMGKAVVSTSVGCEGLHAVDGGNILIRDTAEGFAAAVRAVLEDAELRRRLGSAARETAEKEYAWDVIGVPMVESYLSIARSP